MDGEVNWMRMRMKLWKVQVHFLHSCSGARSTMMKLIKNLWIDGRNPLPIAPYATWSIFVFNIDSDAGQNHFNFDVFCVFKQFQSTDRKRQRKNDDALITHDFSWHYRRCSELCIAKYCSNVTRMWWAFAQMHLHQIMIDIEIYAKMSILEPLLLALKAFYNVSHKWHVKMLMTLSTRHFISQLHNFLSNTMRGMQVDDAHIKTLCSFLMFFMLRISGAAS